MGRFRSSRGGVAWLAFFALACQSVLSFGHVHLGNIGGGSGTWAAVVDGGNSPGAVPQSPPQKDPTGLPRDFCAICANIGLASSLLVPDSPFVLVPSSFVQVSQWPVAATERVAFDHFLFNARGPPVA
jgi:hypothetical protein